MSESNATKWIGMAVERLEDLPLVTGRGRFAGDVSFPHQLHMRMVRSSCAHGRIVAIDTTSGARARRRRRGVDRGRHCRPAADRFPRGTEREARAVSAAGTGQGRGALCRRAGGGGICERSLSSPKMPPTWLTSRSTNCEPLIDRPRCRPGEFAPGRDDRADRIVDRVTATSTAAFAHAHADRANWISSSGRHSGVPLETRGAIGRYDAARDVLELHGAAKVPHRNRELHRAHARPRRRRRCICYEGHVGGGFGVRGEIYPEDVLGLRRRDAARTSGEVDRGPARAHDRRQPFAPAAPPGARRGRRRAADILGIDDEFFHDQGAYVRTHGTRVADDGLRHAAGPVPACRPYRVVGHFRLTNKTPAAHLSRARPLRDHVRARAADGRHRAQARPRSASRCAGAI